MAIIVNPSNVQIGMYVLCETSTGICFTGSARALQFNQMSPVWGSAFGYISGGQNYPIRISTIDRFPFTTDTNSTVVGGLSVAKYAVSGTNSDTAGYTAGGYNPPTTYATIEQTTFASGGATTTSVGNLACCARFGPPTGQSSPTNGYITGGYRPSAGFLSSIQKYSFASSSVSCCIGSISGAKESTVGTSSTISGYVNGGGPATPTAIDKFPFATNSSSTSVGNNIVAGSGAGMSSYSSGYKLTSTCLEKYPFATDSSSTGLLSGCTGGTGANSYQFGYSHSSGPSSPIIKFSFASETSYISVGTLACGRNTTAGFQD